MDKTFKLIVFDGLSSKPCKMGCKVNLSFIVQKYRKLYVNTIFEMDTKDRNIQIPLAESGQGT
jgi:hypothetical protein